MPSKELASGPEATWLGRNAYAATGVMWAADHLALANAAEAGAGLAVLPANLAAFHQLTCVRPLPEIPGRTVWLVYHQDLRSDARLRLVAREVARAIKASLADEARVLGRSSPG